FAQPHLVVACDTKLVVPSGWPSYPRHRRCRGFCSKVIRRTGSAREPLAQANAGARVLFSRHLPDERQLPRAANDPAPWHVQHGRDLIDRHDVVDVERDATVLSGSFAVRTRGLIWPRHDRRNWQFDDWPMRSLRYGASQNLRGPPVEYPGNAGIRRHL